jgi:uncharacterized membrane protein YphA (DoxX/SURF4 family)
MASASRARLGRLLLVLGRLTLAGIFLFAAYGKLRPVNSAPFTAASLKITSSSLSLSMMLFAMQVDSYQILPSWGVMAVSHGLPWLELGIGLFLLLGFGLRWVSLLTTLLVAGFFGVIVRSYFAGMKINCGCFGPGAEPLSGLTILRDGIFLALALGVTIGAFLQARAKREAGALAAAQPAEAARADS